MCEYLFFQLYPSCASPLLHYNRFFTGPWRLFFDGVHRHLLHADLVADFFDQPNSSWPLWSTCRINGQSCQMISQSKMTPWFLLRISKKFGSEIIQRFCESIMVTGHHEAVTLGLCETSKNGCIPKGFPLSTTGDPWHGHGFVTGSWGPFKTKAGTTLESLGELDGGIKSCKLYHPAKCSSDESLGAKALTWAALNGIVSS